MLRFDFYFTLHSHRLLVEYDGQQHFFPMDFFGGEEGFEELKRRDEIKNTFAQEYGFDLIRIPYTVSDIGAYLIREIARITGKSYEDIAFRQPQSSIAPTSFEEASAEGFQLPLFYADD
jgi:very-short-patch-repair endonuclease